MSEYYIVDPEGIIDAVRVCARFNPPMHELVENFEKFKVYKSADKHSVENEVAGGYTVYEALARQLPGLANAIHDFVYQVSNSHGSSIEKNLAREEVAKVFLQIV